MRNKRIWLLTLIFFGSMAAIFTQVVSTKDETDVRGEAYAGSAKCIKCHEKIYASYLQSAHHQSSGPASVHNIHGSFADGHNEIAFSDQSRVIMEKRDNGFYQTAYLKGKMNTSRRFDIVFGGRKAETYLYWKGNQLFELPISYFNSLNSWANSPGYDTKLPYFDRPVVQRCFECHSSYIKDLPQQNQGMQNRVTEFDKKSLIYGIDCERCHGPAAAHVNFQTANPTQKKGKYIVTYQSLTRKQRLDACAVCHGGNKDVFQVSAFGFSAGHVLADFKEPSFSRQEHNPATLDVHGNQNGLLSSSKCFLMSNMDCGTCHNMHKNETSNVEAYSQRCMKCHNAANHNSCKMASVSIDAIKSNCIDCHMPLKPSNLIGVTSSGGEKETPYLVRTHYIAIYPPESKKILAFMIKLKSGDRRISN